MEHGLVTCVKMSWHGNQYWPFVRGIRRWPVDSPHNGTVLWLVWVMQHGLVASCEDVMTGNTNTGPLWGKSTGDQWIPLTMGQYSLLWRILRFDVSCVVSHYRLRLRQNKRRFADNSFKCIFLNENIQNLINMSLKSIPKGQINTIAACVTRPEWRCPNTIIW